MKNFAMIAICFAFIAACVHTAPVPAPLPQQVILKVESATDTKVSVDEDVQKVQNVPYLEPEFDAMATHIGDTVYFTLWSHINVSDTLALWKTIKIAEHKGVKKLHILINSGGGSVFDGLALSDVILGAKKDGFHVVTERMV